MKRIYLLSVLLSLLATLSAFAQQTTGTISGRVTDAEKNAPLEYATISLFNQADSSLVTGTTTNLDGEFVMNAPYGRYYALIQFLSFGSKYQENIILNAANPRVQLGTIALLPDAQTLSEVQVTAEKSQLQLALDKKIFNVGESLARVGGSASDILDNIPSVTVDVEGNVALRGSQNVQILIDGKPSGLVGISGAEALRALPADIIERVEVITNPSARYQAEGVAGIINIILKKERRDGINGSVSANVGYPSNYGASVNFNYRRKWYNLFVNYGIRYYDFTSEGYQKRTYFAVNEQDEDSIKSIETLTLNNRQGLSNSLRFGSDFFLNEYNTLSAAFLYRASSGEDAEELTYLNYNINEVLLGSSIRGTIEEETEPTMEAELNYRRTYDREGRLLTATFQASKETEVEESTIQERLSDNSNGTFLRQNTLNDEAEDSYLFQTDYTHPFAEEGRWEAGVRASWEENINDYEVNQLIDGNWRFIDSLSNVFIYTENVYAAYGIVGNRLGRFSYQLGLRTEYSDINSELLETNEDDPRDYLSLFPSTHFTYALTDNSTVEWSYSRRIRRPGGRWLNPFVSQEDKYSVRRGNPLLEPEFTNSVELGYLHHLSFASITSSVYYRHTTDIIERVTTTIQTDSTQIQVSMPMNLSTENAYGVEFVLNADIADWWSTNTNFNFYRQIIDGGELEGFETDNISSDTYTWNARTNMQFKISDGLSAQTNFFYRAPMENIQGRSKALYIMDAGISKDLFNKKGKLTLSVSDVLNTRRWRSIVITDDFIREGEFQWRPRTFTLGFTYQLRRSNKRGERPEREQRQEGGDGEEMDF